MSDNGREPYTRLVEPPEKASQSLLKRIDVCPYSGALYLDFKGGPQTHAMARGEAFHQFAQEATNTMIEAGEPQMPPEVAKDHMQAVIEGRPDLALPGFEQEACRIMAWHWGEATFLDLEHLVCVETMIEAEVGGWKVRGKVDRAEIVGNLAFVYDYKTSLNLPDQETIDEEFQLLVYALLLAEGTPENETIALARGVDTFELYQLFPRYTHPETGLLVDRHTTKDRAQLADFKRTLESHLAKLDHGLATGEWAATEGSWCKTCPASQECPIPADLRDFDKVTDPGTALEAVERIKFIDAERGTLRRELKDYADENGEVVLGDEVWGFKYGESLVLEGKRKEALLAELEAEGRVEEFFSKRKSTKFDRRTVEGGAA